MVIAAGACFYFAYGSNMSHEFLCERLKDGEWDGWKKTGILRGEAPKLIGVYQLSGYEFGYTLRDEDEAAGNVQPRPGSHVYGVLYTISEEHLGQLDQDENVPEQYERTALKVKLVANKILDASAPEEVEAYVYVGTEKYYTTALQPDPVYVNLLVTAAQTLNIPDEYIDNYLQIPCEEAVAVGGD